MAQFAGQQLGKALTAEPRGRVVKINPFDAARDPGSLDILDPANDSDALQTGNDSFGFRACRSRRYWRRWRVEIRQRRELRSSQRQGSYAGESGGRDNANEPPRGRRGDASPAPAQILARVHSLFPSTEIFSLLRGGNIK